MEVENKRKVVLINKRFQTGLIARFILVNIVIMSLYGGLLYLFLDNEVQSNLYSAHVTYRNMKGMLWPIVLTLSALNIIVSSIIISVFVLFVSHRIAGPLFRFKSAVNEICQRNLRPYLALRKKDELFPLSDTLQEMTNLLKEDVGNIGEVLGRIKEINQSLASSDLAVEIEKMESIIHQYQI